MIKTIAAAFSREKLSVKIRLAAFAAAVAAAVALQQLCHSLGALSGLGTGIGEALLPMHLPIILAGLLAGPVAAGAAGLAAPLISFALSGMPSAAILPFMMIELCVYGAAAGLLRNAKLPCVFKVLIAQLAGRAVRAAAILFAVYALGAQGISPAIIYTSVLTGIFGIILQLVLIPLIDCSIKSAADATDK